MTTRFDTAIVNGTAIIPCHGPAAMTIAIKDGKIAGLLEPGEAVEADEIIDASSRVIFPGFIDPHMHIGFVGLPLTDVVSETRSAAIGGVTTILNYVLKPDDYAPHVAEFVDYVERLSYVDMAIHLGIFSEEHVEAIPSYIRDYGVTSFKFFMSYKGDEGPKRGVGTTDEGLLFDLMTKVASIPGAIVNIHAENIEMIWRLEERVKELGTDGLAAHNDARPGMTEAADVVTAAFVAKATNCPFYLVHISSRESVNEIRKLRKEMSGLFVETTPHYLSLTIHSDCGLLAKINPPVRFQEDIDSLWEAIKDGVVDTVGNDHSACFRSDKEGGVWKAGSAFPGVGTMLAILLSEGYHKRGVSLQTIAEIGSYNTARIFNLYPRKGTIEVGSDADLAIVDLDKEMVVESEYLQSRADFSPWEGWRMKGWTTRTLVRGKTVMNEGEIVGTEGYGTYLRRSVPSIEAAHV